MGSSGIDLDLGPACRTSMARAGGHRRFLPSRERSQISNFPSFPFLAFFLSLHSAISSLSLSQNLFSSTRLYNNVIAPSELPARANYYLFKEGIKPAWEDPANGKGGKWSIQLPRDKTRSKIDQIWLYTMLSAIGETLEQPFDSSSTSNSNGGDGDELITGVILAARPNFFRVAVWTTKSEETLSDGENASELSRRLMDIGKQFKVGVLGYGLEQRVATGLGTEVEFQSHVESDKRKGKKTSLVSLMYLGKRRSLMMSSNP